MWKTSTLQQFLEWNLHFHVNTQRACVYRQYYFTIKINHKKQSKRSRADILLQEIISWSHNLCCFTNYWVGIFVVVVVVQFFWSLNLWLRRFMVFYYCVSTGVDSRWNHTVDFHYLLLLVMIFSLNASSGVLCQDSTSSSFASSIVCRVWFQVDIKEMWFLRLTGVILASETFLYVDIKNKPHI